jgi:hypothetical protein
VGIHCLQSVDDRYYTELVAVMSPEALAAFLSDGNYLPRRCSHAEARRGNPRSIRLQRRPRGLVDAITMGATRERNGRGRPLLIWQGCCVIAFLMNWQSATSLNGR